MTHPYRASFDVEAPLTTVCEQLVYLGKWRGLEECRGPAVALVHFRYGPPMHMCSSCAAEVATRRAQNAAQSNSETK